MYVFGRSFHDAYARSPESQTTAGVITLRSQFGQMPVKSKKSTLYDASSAKSRRTPEK